MHVKGKNMLAEKIGLQLKEIRIGLRLSQAEFAAKMNVSQAAMSKYELGKTTPDCIFLNRLHELFGVDIGHLVTGEPQPKTVSNVPHLIDAAVYYKVMDMAKTLGHYTLLDPNDTVITFCDEVIDEYERAMMRKRH